MTLDRNHTCPACGKAKRRPDVACRSCWNALPLGTRIAFTKAVKPGRRRILRFLLAHWRKVKP
jgi:hypothetical protein